jgi:TrmH family RNA methyltransferase
VISSRSNAHLQLVRALAGKPKRRRDERAFLAEGVRLVEEARAAAWPFRFVLFSENLSPRGRSLLEGLRDDGVQVQEVDARLLGSLSDTDTSQGILAVMEESQLPLPERIDLALIPDSIRDPGNLGTLLRAAEAAGAQLVLLPPETTDAFGPKVVRAGMGAQFRLSITEMEWEDIRRLLKERRLNAFMADMGGVPCWEADLTGPLVLIVGGEAEGATAEARAAAAQSISIPMEGRAESLNAAVAGSILMFEVLRQRRARTGI